MCQNALSMVWFDLVSLFDGISTFVGYSMCRTSFYLTHSWKDKGVHTFLKGIFSKVNVILFCVNKICTYVKLNKLN